jgi:hypothetical protein
VIYLWDKYRLQNIFWTVSGDYTIDLEKFHLKPVDFYESAILGISAKYYDFEVIDDYIKKFILRQNNRDELIAIAKIVIENVFYEKIIQERPGTIDFRKEHEEKILSLRKRQKIILPEELALGFLREKKGEYSKIQENLSQMLDEILEFKSLDTLEYIEFLQNLFKKYFHVNKELKMDMDDEFKEFKEKSKKKFKAPKKKSKFIDVELLEKYSIESAEFTFFLDEDDDIRVKEDAYRENSFSEEAIYKKIVKKYGVEKIPRYITQKIESKISTGIHEDIKLFFPSGNFDTKNSFEESLMDENYKENLAFYNENKLLYKRATRELSSVIKNSLLKDVSDEITRSNSGNIVPRDIWKSKKLNEDRIFERIKKGDSPEITVDILLDSSASELQRKEIIATETFIIAEALTSLNIKTRIFSFNNYYNYLILRKYRDYNDPKFKNKEIFKYSPSGSNRDGLAIKFMRHLLEKERDVRRFLIVLSDGLPFDEINVGLVGKATIPGFDYKEDEAVKDAAKEIMLMKMRGVNTFGVFTGEESEIKNIKKIYDNDFAYITDISRFHKVIGVFLKTFANKIE